MNGKPRGAAKKALYFWKRLGGLGLVFTLALMPGGCVSNDELDQVRMDRDEFRGELQRLHLSNDDLKREISQTYASCDQIGTQLTLMAAMNIHDQYTDKLGRRPVRPDPVDPPSSGPKPTPSGKPVIEGVGKIAGGKGGTKQVQTSSPDSKSVRVDSGSSIFDGMDLGSFDKKNKE